MATSGVVAEATLNVEELLAQAFRRCGKVPSTVSGELMRDARRALQMMLWSMSNKGVNLWCLRKNVFNLVEGNAVFSMTKGTVDVMNVLLRQLTEPAGTPFSAADQRGVQLAAPDFIRNVSGRFTAGGTVSLTVEASGDGVTWTSVTDLNSAVVEADSQFTIDLDNSYNVAWWRLRDTSGTLLPMADLKFRNNFNELPVSKYNRDEYQQLPDKMRRGGRPLQFWFDKQVDPQLWIWPVPDSSAGQQQLVVWEQSLIEDAGALTNELAVPRRWLMAITCMAAVEVCFLIPPVELAPGKLNELTAKANEERAAAEGGESDGSPMNLLPRIGVYTR